MSGYELKKQLSVKLGAFWRVSFGSLYPCLKRLLADGALEVEENRFTSRKKHVYRLTERGEQVFLELLESADVHDLEQDRFSMRLAFFRYLRPATRPATAEPPPGPVPPPSRSARSGRALGSRPRTQPSRAILPCRLRPVRPRRPHRGVAIRNGQDTRRDRRRGQLRVIAGAGRSLLPARPAGRRRPRSDAHRARVLPRQ